MLTSLDDTDRTAWQFFIVAVSAFAWLISAGHDQLGYVKTGPARPQFSPASLDRKPTPCLCDERIPRAETAPGRRDTGTMIIPVRCFTCGRVCG